MIGCLRTHVRKQPIIVLYVEFKIVHVVYLSESSLGAHTYCLFCHVMAHLLHIFSQRGMLKLEQSRGILKKEQSRGILKQEQSRGMLK